MWDLNVDDIVLFVSSCRVHTVMRNNADYAIDQRDRGPHRGLGHKEDLTPLSVRNTIQNRIKVFYSLLPLKSVTIQIPY